LASANVRGRVCGDPPTQTSYIAVLCPCRAVSDYLTLRTSVNANCCQNPYVGQRDEWGYKKQYPSHVTVTVVNHADGTSARGERWQPGTVAAPPSVPGWRRYSAAIPGQKSRSRKWCRRTRTSV